MDIKNMPLRLAPDTSLLRSRTAGLDGATPSENTRKPGASGDPAVSNGVAFHGGATAALVDSGLQEALAIHEAELDALAAQIRTGDYTADLDIVASRVADVLGI